MSSAVCRSTRGWTPASSTIVARRRRRSSVSISVCSRRSGLACSCASVLAAARGASANQAASATIRPPLTRLTIARSKAEPVHRAAGARASSSRGEVTSRSSATAAWTRSSASKRPSNRWRIRSSAPSCSSMAATLDASLASRSRSASISGRSAAASGSTPGSGRSSSRRASSTASSSRRSSCSSSEAATAPTRLSPGRTARPRRRGWSPPACAGCS